MVNHKISFILHRLRRIISSPAFIALSLLVVIFCGIKYYTSNSLEYCPEDSVYVFLIQELASPKQINEKIARVVLLDLFNLELDILKEQVEFLKINVERLNQRILSHTVFERQNILHSKSEPRSDGKEFDQNAFDVDFQQAYQNVSETEMEFSFDYEALAKSLKLKHRSTFPFFDLPFISYRIYSIFHDDYHDRPRHVFRNMADFIFAKKFNDLKSEEVKCGDIVYVKSQSIEEFMSNYFPKIKYPFFLLTHENDDGVGGPKHLELINDPKIIKWFADHTLMSHPKLVPLPLGVVTPPENAFSTLYDLAKTPIPYYNKKLLLYLNFSPHTNKDRIQTLSHFQKTFGNNSLVKIDSKRTSWKEYLENIKNSQFVLSPPGNGIDCYRTWEALYLGSVPIVQESYLQPLYDGMPIMVVKDWNEVTEESMKKFQREKLGNFSKDGLPWRKKIWLRYWINEIIGTKKNYIKDFCS